MSAFSTQAWGHGVHFHGGGHGGGVVVHGGGGHYGYYHGYNGGTVVIYPFGIAPYAYPYYPYYPPVYPNDYTVNSNTSTTSDIQGHLEWQNGQWVFVPDTLQNQ